MGKGAAAGEVAVATTAYLQYGLIGLLGGGVLAACLKSGETVGILIGGGILLFAVWRAIDTTLRLQASLRALSAVDSTASAPAPTGEE